MRAFDTADVARLRDRAKLHILVDDVLATALGRFAGDAAELVAKRLRAEAQSGLRRGRRGGARRGPRRRAGAAARRARRRNGCRSPKTPRDAFGADASSGAWSTDLETGLRSSIVLGALGGPAVGLVDAIARALRRRAARRVHEARAAGRPRRRRLRRVRRRARRPTSTASPRGSRRSRAGWARASPRSRRACAAEALGPLDRALAAHAGDGDRASGRARARASAPRPSRALATRIETRTEAFARESRAERAELADPGDPARSRMPAASASTPPRTRALRSADLRARPAARALARSPSSARSSAASRA